MFPLARANFTSVSPDQTVHENSILQLFCEASGSPAPNITWTRVLQDGSNSDVLHRGRTWNFANISSGGAGTYRCTANNGIGSAVSHVLKVIVLCKYIDQPSVYNIIYDSKVNVTTRLTERTWVAFGMAKNSGR